MRNETVVKTKQCKECGEDFDIRQGELEFLRSKFGDDFNEPARCKPCRDLKKQRKR